MEPRHRKSRPSPYTSANCLSKLTLWWIQDLYRANREAPITEQDTYDVLAEDSSAKLANQLGREWEKELYLWRSGGYPSLYKALFRCFAPRVIAVGFVFMFQEILRLSQAIFLWLLLKYFTDSDDTRDPHVYGYYYAAGWSGAFVLVTILDNFAFHKCYYYGMKMRIACTSLIYRKLLRLSQYSLYMSNTNNLVNLLAAETHRFDQSCLGINYIWIAPLEAFAVSVILWHILELGAVSMVGTAVIILLIPVQYFLGKVLSKLRIQMSSVSHRRVGVMAELLTGIETIKINCWEKAFSNLIGSLRKSEFVYLRGLTHIRGLNSAIYLASGKLSVFGLFSLLVFLDHSTHMSAFFAALALCEVLRTSLSLLMPWGVQYFVDALRAVNKIEQFLLLEERNMLEYQTQTNLGSTVSVREVFIKFEDYAASWSKDTRAATLEGISFAAKKNELIAIVGSPQSGKSSLLLAVLSEVPRLGGFLNISGTTAYVPCQTWIFPGTIRENVLFGHDFDINKYTLVLRSCGMTEDLDNFTDGDLTLLGDKGIALSTVQKIRVSLARAAYHSASIYLIDDVLAYMNHATAKHIYKKCFKGILRTRCILLVTSNMEFIQSSDKVLVLRAGKIDKFGKYEDLRNEGVDFTEFVADDDPLMDESEIILEALSDICADDPILEETYVKTEHGSSGYSSQVDLSSNKSTAKEIPTKGEEKLNIMPFDFRDCCESELLSADDSAYCDATSKTYVQYFRAAAASFWLLAFVVIAILTQVAFVLTDWCLYVWVKEHSSSTLSNASDFSTSTISILLSTSSIDSDTANLVNQNFLVYVSLLGVVIILTLAKSVIFSSMALRAAHKLHDLLLNSILRAKLVYFIKYSPARILTRFGKDINYVDDCLPAGLEDCTQFIGLVINILVLSVVANYWMCFVVIPIIVVILLLRYYYSSSAYDLRRVECTSQIPVYHHISNTLDGLLTVRSFQNEDRFLRNFDIYQNRHTSASYVRLIACRWFTLRLDLMSAVFVAMLAFVAVLNKNDINVGLVGLTMVYTLNYIGLLQHSTRQTVDIHSQMSSVERISDMSALPPESDLVTSLRPPASWPQYGIITFEGVSVVADDGGRLLKRLFCCVRAQEKVGVLSDSYSSKHALVSALVRTLEPQGIVRIDAIDIKELGLHDLREKMAIVSQDPKLFGGSVRRNLDPFTRYPDAHIWKVLADVQLKDKVERLPGKMYAELSEFGDSFNVHERQLMCLAQALLRNSKILVVEEPLESLEKKSLMSLCTVVHTCFTECTVLFLANKIHSVVDADRIMILEEGKLKEIDPAHVLLSKENNHLDKYVKHLSENELLELKSRAKAKFEDKPYIAPPQSLGGDVGVPLSSRGQNKFLPSFHNNRLSGALSGITANRFSTNRF